MKAMKFSPLTFFTGKSATAVSMAKYYSAACLNIDSVVLEAISDGSNISGLRARELCIRAAIEQSMKEEESGKSPSPQVFMVEWPAPHYCSWPSSLCPSLSFSPKAPLKADLYHAADLGRSLEENFLHQATAAPLAAQCTAGKRTMNKAWPTPWLLF